MVRVNSAPLIAGNDVWRGESVRSAECPLVCCCYTFKLFLFYIDIAWRQVRRCLTCTTAWVLYSSCTGLVSVLSSHVLKIFGPYGSKGHKMAAKKLVVL